MKKSNFRNYITPIIEVIDTDVEKGFAATNGFADPGVPGGPIDDGPSWTFPLS